MKTLTVMFMASLAFATVGCKKKAGEPPTCANAINHSMELSKAEMQKMGTDDQTIQKLIDLGIQRCTEDKWSAAARTCMVDAKAMADAQGCYDQLTAEQQEKMNKAAMELATPGAAEGDAAGAGSDAGSADDAGSAGSATGSATGGSAAGSAETGAAGSAAPAE